MSKTLKDFLDHAETIGESETRRLADLCLGMGRIDESGKGALEQALAGRLSEMIEKLADYEDGFGQLASSFAVAAKISLNGLSASLGSRAPADLLGEVTPRNIRFGKGGWAMMAVSGGTAIRRRGDALEPLARVVALLQEGGNAKSAALAFSHGIETTKDAEGLSVFSWLLELERARMAEELMDLSERISCAETARDLKTKARDMLDRALEGLSPTKPRLIAVGGFSGSGKSTLARELAAGEGRGPGALVLRSDAVRKQIWGAKLSDTLPAEAYANEVTGRVVDEMDRRAKLALAAGYTVIADATHGLPGSRSRVEALARSLNVPFTGIWVEAPEEVLRKRLNTRTGDVSDADSRVLDIQLGKGSGPISWPRVVNDAEIGKAVAAARKILAAPKAPTPKP
jgi:predicted kinase